MATKMTYDNLAHELGRVALSRDELRFELYNVKKEREEALAKLAAMESQSADKPAVAVPDVNFIASTLMDAWKFAEPSHGVTANMTSYVSTFVDMARAVIRIHFAAAPSHSQQSAHTVPAEAYAQATEAINNIYGASQHCDCHSFEIAKQWRDETHGGTIYYRCPSHESEQP